MLTRMLLALGLMIPAACTFAQADKRNVLMIAGRPSHGFGSHEHYAGLKILEEAVEASSDQIDCTVVKGWPEDASLIENADSIVIYSDGGKGHPAIKHLDQLTERLKQGCGFVCLHYAVEMVPGPPGDFMVEYLGGHFEINWSVNPHWIANFQSLPDHPITRGVKPFATNDEWYFHMRFNESDKVVPILAAVAPEATMRRKDGPHSGNPDVRKSVARGDQQTVAWAFERPDGGRSFGFTGGHYHWNWGNDEVRRLVTNAIRWSAGDQVSDFGSTLGEDIGVDKLLENQDYPKPKNFDAEKTSEEFNLQSSNSKDPRHASNALAGIEMGSGLQATLAASEPHVRSLSNCDIDDRGRVWVMDVMNYGPKYHDIRPEGDRIVICEDTSGDGVMDSFTTYYQGNEINSAMGICILGDQVLVTATPHVFRFSDTDGDDKADTKEILFTGIQNPKHDHSGHSFSFGPDGKLYWNFGNSGKQVLNAKGETVIDIHGRAVVDNGKPFFGGMPFRCDLDGTKFEVLAHNFRNNWEVAVDSFGTLWQSDNDDDGNKATRINYVMEHGNFGYRDELTGAGWQSERITMDDSVPRRHWHLNDPGVVPNILLTGAGSPAGICVYEGRLLPKRFWDQVIHCDPGPNTVRAYPVKADGAGYRASTEPLMTGTKDNWFRPIDPCVAPDGSLFVTDWYDPGVGGHQQQDRSHGRLFRIAPPGSGYIVPKFEYSTAKGAVAALRNPNLAVRYKAWTALHEMGVNAEPELLKLYSDPNPRLQARALWLLGKIDGRGKHYVEKAVNDPNPNIRITAIRLAKQIGLSPSQVCVELASDPSAAVRRELAVALKFDDSESMPAVWAQLAEQHDGDDRWYLEALGIGSDERANECYEAWLRLVNGNYNTPSGRDIVFRVRADKAANHLVAIIGDSGSELKQTDRYFRALEYHKVETRTAAMQPLLGLDDEIVLRAADRMTGINLADDARVQGATSRLASKNAGTPRYIDLVSRYPLPGMNEELGQMVVGDFDDGTRVRAAQLLTSKKQGRKVLRQLLLEQPPTESNEVATVLANLGNGRARSMLSDVVEDGVQPYRLRRNVVAAMSQNVATSKKLLAIAEAGRLPADTRLLAGGLLARSSNQEVRAKAAQMFPQPIRKDRQPLPPLDKLAKETGDADNGKKLFRGAATCANCHVVGGFGKSVGPDLTEIGSKLSREAMLTSILDPSAGISHNYEGYVVLTTDGQVINGLLISKTDGEVVIRTVDGIDRKIPSDEIEMIKQSEKSIMPEDLHHTTDQQGLIDVVEYMVGLKKK